MLTVDRERLFFPEGFAGCMQACAFGRFLIWWIDRSLTTKIFGLFTGSNVRGGRPQLAEHNLLAVGHRLRYRRDRHGHLPSRVSIPTISFVSLFYSLYWSTVLSIVSAGRGCNYTVGNALPGVDSQN